MKTQINPANFSKEILKNFGKIEKLEDFEKLRKLLYAHLNVINIETEEQKRQEIEIRWKRTWEEILEQKNVYNWKACTDIVIAYMTLLKQLWINSYFIKLKKENFIHSVIELEFNSENYIFDISAKIPIYEKAKFEEWKIWRDWTFWKKWIDSWDLGLKKYSDSKKES